MQLEAIHVQLRINTSAVVKKGNGTQQKIHDAHTVATVDGEKAPFGPKQRRMVKRRAHNISHC